MSKYGQLAYEYSNVKLFNQVLYSAAGYYIGTCDDEGPVSRESVEYFPSRDAAAAALREGQWTQRDNP